MIDTLTRLWRGQHPVFHADQLLIFGYVAVLTSGLAIGMTAHVALGTDPHTGFAHLSALGYAVWASIGARRCRRHRPLPDCGCCA